MKKFFIPFLLCAFLWTAPSLQAQDTIGMNFIGAKLLFLDYGRPNSADDLNITNGLEVVYQRNFNRFVSVALPAKIGVSNVVGELNNQRFLSVDGLLHLHWYKPMARVVPYLLVGAGVVLEDFSSYNYQLPMGGGLHIRIGKNSYLNIQGEYRASDKADRNNIQAGFGFIYRLGKMAPDSDGDKVPDNVDACPDEPGLPALGGCPDRDADGVSDRQDNCPDLAGLPALAGCPDSDGDGIADKDDQCPTEAGIATLFGCPDRDGDKVADRFDECPDEPGLPSNNGCPLRDADKDGIPDDMDDCPNEPGPKSTMGCPDRDNDGVPDASDRCPTLAGKIGGCPDTDNDGLVDPDDRCPNEAGPASNKGCPEIKEEVKEVLKIAMRAVQFETGSATLKPESFAVLDQISGILNQYPSYKLRIAGHTDNVGDDRANLVLSEQRAKACYQYLISKGAAPARLSFQGFGELRPIAPNTTREGRTLNRRVEFDLYLDGE